jgi:hypothetical protein
MGQLESKERKNEFMIEFSSKYIYMKELVDKRFGEISVFKSHEKYIARRGHICNSSEEYIDYVK